MKTNQVVSVREHASVFFVIALFFVSVASVHSVSVWRVDALGNITVNGQVIRVKGVSWTGLEGREQPASIGLPSGVPMELYMGNVFWAESGRTYAQDISELKSMGFNMVRLPIVPQTLDPVDPYGMEPYLTNAQTVRIANARLALETVIKQLDAAGIYVLLDIHSCSNFVGWRAGRLDARPPYPDSSWTDYSFKREECSCAATANPASVTRIQAYGVEKWLANIKTLAGLTETLGVDNIMGIDVFNEPWDYTWNEWKTLVDQAYTAIDAVNQNILIFVQGIHIAAGSQDGTPSTTTRVPHGNEALKPCRGENLFEAGAAPPSVPKNRLVFSPHVFGPSVFVQSMFMDPAQPQCAGLEGDVAGDAKCNIVINQSLLEQGWEEHFGYLTESGYAIAIGEFGGNPDWPRNADLRTQNRYSYLTDTTVDWKWQNAFMNYLLKKGIFNFFYSSLNPESLDTGGIYRHAYDPVTNTEGWGIWMSVDQRKLDLLQQIWVPTPHPDPTPVSTPLQKKGDANGDNNVDIIDALVTAQYYVGTTPARFNATNADVDCSGVITIVDALRIAQFYVGLLGSLDCP